MTVSSRYNHWTPRYVVNRAREFLFRTTNPGLPWLTPKAIKLLQGYLKPTHCGLEFGSGRSTLWFAQRIQQLTSVEHDSDWYQRVKQRMERLGVTNVTYLFIPVEKENRVAYPSVAEQFADRSLDFVLVDGAERSSCALKSMGKIKPGGLLVIDNANWVLPSSSFSPASRTMEQGPEPGEWQEFLERISGWRCLWTSNGVTDTALYFRGEGQ
jgi:predicted O-methyltransferase YrrM